MSELTPQEMNLRIAELVYPDADTFALAENYIQVTTDEFIEPFNYCENWSDLMPLLVEYCDKFEFDRNRGIAKMRDNNGYWHYAKNKDPQIALAECLLKVLESKADDI